MQLDKSLFKNVIEVSEVLQGEGPTMGRPRVLVRFAGCPLRCSFCDTAYSWNVPSEPNTQKMFEKFESLTKQIPYLMFTGGEPLLYPIQVLKLIESGNFSAEVETSGVLSLTDKSLFDIVSLFIVSPKRADVQKTKLDTTPVLLEQLVKYAPENFVVKFVITDQKDFDFVHNTIQKFSIPRKKVWVMPFTRGAAFMTSELAWKFALTNKFNYSDRLHVRVFGTKRGV